MYPNCEVFTLKFLDDNGILFEVNRRVLHPLGLSLQVSSDGQAELFQTTDPVGMVFTAGTFQAGESELLEYMAREGDSRLISRQAFLQFIEQVGPDQGIESSPGNVEG